MSLIALHVRVDSSRNRDGEFVKFIKSHCESYLVVHECGAVTEKPHFHALCYTASTQRKMRDQLLKIMPDLKGKKRGGKGCYSVAVAEHPDALRRYLMKGSSDAPPDVVACNFMDHDVDAEWRESRTVEADKMKKEKTMLAKAKSFWQDHSMWLEDEHDVEYQRRRIAEWLICECVQNDKPIVKNYLRSIVNTIVAGYNPEAKLDLARVIAQDY